MKLFKWLHKIGLHSFKKVGRTINGHGQIIDSYSCSCGCSKKRVKNFIISNGLTIVSEFSWYYDDNGKFIREEKSGYSFYKTIDL